jgi:hypothetical protein
MAQVSETKQSWALETLAQACETNLRSLKNPYLFSHSSALPSLAPHVYWLSHRLCWSIDFKIFSRKVMKIPSLAVLLCLATTATAWKIDKTLPTALVNGSTYQIQFLRSVSSGARVMDMSGGVNNVTHTGVC